MRYKNIFYINSEPLKNLGNFRDYLISNSESLTTLHFFLGFSNKYPYVEKYKFGKKILRKEFNIYKGNNNYIRNILYFIFYFYILFKYADRDSYVITTSPIFCFLNIIGSFFKNTRHVFWIGDYYPSKKFPMNIYHTLVDYYNNKLKYVLYVSPPLKKIYFKKSQNQKYRSLATLGIKKENTKKHINKKILTVGFVGVIREQQGLDLFFDFLKKTSKNTKLEVVGDGYKLEFYKNKTKELGIKNKVKFYGFVKNEAKIFKKWDVGLALYENTSSNLSKYCEPTKIKHYLKYGLPVITTNTTYFYKDINRYKAGEVVKENVGDLNYKIKKIITNYDFYLQGVEKIVKHFNYEKWYKKEFKFMEGK